MTISDRQIRVILQRDAERVVATPELRRRLNARLHSPNSARIRTLVMATAAVVVVLVGIAASVIANDSRSRPTNPNGSAARVKTTTLSSLPVPTDVQITPPDRRLPPELAGFSGTWEGTVNGSLHVRFIVERIDEHSAQVVYVWSKTPDDSVAAGWRRFNADVLSGGRIAWGRGTTSAGQTGPCDAHGNACSVLRFVLTMSTDRQSLLISRDIFGYPPFMATVRRPGFHPTQNLVIGLIAILIVVVAALALVGVPALRTRTHLRPEA